MKYGHNTDEPHHGKTGYSMKRTRHRSWRDWGLFLVVLVILVAVGRAIMPWLVRDYVNRTLDRNILYSGKIGAVQIHLWRGAYSIRDVRINKTTGDVPVPLFEAKRVDFSLEWKALLHGKMVGRFLVEQPEINFVDASNEAQTQTGDGGAWLEMIQNLFPFQINEAVIENGLIHFRTFQKTVPVDIYLSNVNASIQNLSNIRGETTPLAATVQASALAMDEAKLEFKMKLDPFSYHPTFHLAARLLNLDLKKINDLAIAYGKFDFERGWFDLVIEADAKEGLLNGYVKPLFRNVKIFNLSEDLKEDNVLEFFWEALLGATKTVFKNWSRDQFGTLIPFSGNASATSADILATLGNVLRNAFVRAYLPRLQGVPEESALQFKPPEITDPISPTDTF